MKMASRTGSKYDRGGRMRFVSAGGRWELIRRTANFGKHWDNREAVAGRLHRIIGTKKILEEDLWAFQLVYHREQVMRILISLGGESSGVIRRVTKLN